MKAKNLANIKPRYTFEAPVFQVIASNNKKLLEIADNENTLDLNELLTCQSKDIFLVKVSGESMIDENIFDGDLLIVEKNEIPTNGKIVIAALNGEMAVKTYKLIDNHVYLISANKKFLPIEIKDYMEFQIQGVVKHVIHKV